ncbi:hypothetical protein [Acetobacter thailandicus]|uniref:hypothetical protein n=1 Tax=Acetobacter thailandicus TaxID=1502842 RepID=UPI001BADB462|nr:hypothetical protein [Acetobacter thailandicus]MBS0961296.1 hypothetical protein [Acetobacter thailandicus]MBS1004497.1 hypothetical protein [Acetobacter thailandicus]
MSNEIIQDGAVANDNGHNPCRKGDAEYQTQTAQLVISLACMVGRAVAHEYFSNLVAVNENKENTNLEIK